MPMWLGPSKLRERRLESLRKARDEESTSSLHNTTQKRSTFSNPDSGGKSGNGGRVDVVGGGGGEGSSDSIEGRSNRKHKLKPPKQRPPSLLTLLLIRLDAVLGGYFENLSHPTPENVASAARMLDGLFRTSGEHRHQDSNNKRSNLNSGSTLLVEGDATTNMTKTAMTPDKKLPSAAFHGHDPSAINNTPSAPTIPSNSHLRQQQQQEYHHIPQTSPLSKVERMEWDRIVGPLVLLAGAEALYARLEHVGVPDNPSLPSKPTSLLQSSVKSSTMMMTTDANNTEKVGKGGGKTKLTPRSPRSMRSKLQLDRIGRAGGVGGMSPSRLLSLPSSPGNDDEKEAKEKEGMNPKGRGTVSGNMTKGSRSRGRRHEEASQLIAMYNQVGKDVIIVKEILCDPILGHATLTTEKCGEEASNDDKKLRDSALDITHYHAEAASRVSSTLSAIVTMVEARKELVLLHSDLISSRSALRWKVSRNELPLDVMPSGNGTSEAGILNSRNEHIDGTASAADPHEDHDRDENSSSSFFSLLQISQKFDGVLGKLPSVAPTEEGNDWMSCGHVSSAIEVVRAEVEASSAASAASHYLEECCFFEIILHVKKLQVRLGPSSPFHSDPASPLQMWLRTILTDILSDMSIVFDRVEAFSSSVYCFKNSLFRNRSTDRRGSREGTSTTALSNSQPSIVEGRAVPPLTSSGKLQNSFQSAEQSHEKSWHDEVKDYDSNVLDFLHKHENKGGLPLAVAVVYDAKDGTEPHFECGFICKNRNGGDDSALAGSDISSSAGDLVYGVKSWPAVYLRTSKRSRIPNSSSSSSSVPNFSQLLTNASSHSTEKRHQMSNSPRAFAGLPPLLVGGSLTTAPHMRRNESSDSLEVSLSQPPSPRPKYSKAQEYWPDGGIDLTWPHTEWPTLVSILMEDFVVGAHREDSSESRSEGVFTFRDYPKRLDTSKDELSTDNLHDEGWVHHHHNHHHPPTSTLDQVDHGMKADHHHHPRSRPNKSSSSNKNFFPSAAENDDSSSLVDEVGGRGGGDAVNVSPPHLQSRTSSSVYHISRINAKMWMVAIVKGEEEKWHRKRSRGLTDEEIRSFLTEMTNKLSIDRLLGPDTVARARTTSAALDVSSSSTTSSSTTSDPSLNLLNIWGGGAGKWQDIDTQQFLGKLRHRFGLNTTTALMLPLKSPFAASVRSSPETNENQELKKSSMVSSSSSSWSGLDEGAIYLFFGKDLGTLMQDAT